MTLRWRPTSRSGWEQKYEQIADLHQQAEFSFIEQPRDGRYGTALPALLAEDFVADDDFFLIADDDLLLRSDGGSDLAAARDDENDIALLELIFEKPAHCAGAEAHANISRSLLPADNLPFRDLAPAHNGEYQATDAIEAYARDQRVLIHPISGTYYDCGNTRECLPPTSLRPMPSTQTSRSRHRKSSST